MLCDGRQTKATTKEKKKYAGGKRVGLTSTTGNINVGEKLITGEER